MRVPSLLLTISLFSILQSAGANNNTILAGAYPQRMSDRYTEKDGLPGKKISNIQIIKGQITAQTDGGQAVFSDGSWRSLESNRQAQFTTVPADIAKLPAGVKIMSTAQLKNGILWIVTDRGVFHSLGDQYIPFSKPKAYLTRQPPVNIDAPITCVAADGTGNIWFGTTAGLYATNGADFWNPVDRASGLPYENITCIAFGNSGDIWAGTSEGVCRYTKDGKWQYYSGPRWLPNNHVNAIIVDEKGSAWAATDGGVAHLFDVSVTLDKKAEHYEQITARHNRGGYVTGGSLKKPGDVTGGVVHEASDNDGLWTACYVGAECFRYATTKDPAAKALAKKSMWAMLDLLKYTGVPGFPARSVQRKDEKDVQGYNSNETVRVAGESDKIWFTSPIDPNVWCKGDTSSDETDGHYFAWYLYYTLVADGDERKSIASAVTALTDNILSHDLTLVGPTGRHTLWGVWNPKFINDDPQWWEERGINSLEILAYLKLAEHVSGNPKYAQKYQELIEKNYYLLNTVNQKVGYAWYGENHSDDQMSYMVYYVLLSLEKDPDIRRVLIQSLDRSWRFAREEDSPFFNFVYGALTGQRCEAEKSLETLQEWPWELISWRCDNSQRTDIAFRSINISNRPKSESTTVVPAGERHLERWNGNPYELEGGSIDGREEEDGSAWLLPYWMGRYHGLLSEK